MTDKQLSKSSASLAAADLSASADNALAALGHAGENAVALVEAWVKAGNADAVNVASERATGPARKAARRGLNVLKARGIAIPTKNHVTSVGGEKAPEIAEALMLAPDSGGSVCLVITSRSPTSRAHSVFVYLHDDFGVHRVNVGDLSQSQLKEALAKALPGADYRPVKVPVSWARARVAAARKACSSPCRASPRNIRSTAKASSSVTKTPKTWPRTRTRYISCRSSAAGSPPKRRSTRCYSKSVSVSRPAANPIPKSSKPSWKKRSSPRPIATSRPSAVRASRAQ